MRSLHCHWMLSRIALPKKVAEVGGTQYGALLNMVRQEGGQINTNKLIRLCGPNQYDIQNPIYKRNNYIYIYIYILYIYIYSKIKTKLKYSIISYSISIGRWYKSWLLLVPPSIPIPGVGKSLLPGGKQSRKNIFLMIFHHVY